MKQYAFYIALLLSVISCKNHHRVSALKTSNLKSSFITINSDSGYVVKTAKGATLKIAKHTFDVPANTTVAIELKEAYSIQDILLAGLSTISNKRLLQSGGMLYLNATANGKAINFLKPVTVSVPTKEYNDSMQLFKGAIKDDSSINWTDPTPLDSSSAEKTITLGEMLFKANCANCHKPTEDFTGPALAGARQRAPDPEWPYRFTINTNKMVETDPYAKALMQKYGSVMTQFMYISKNNIKAILDFCDSKRKPVATDSSIMPAAVPGADSAAKQQLDCGYDTIPVPDVATEILPVDDPITDSAYNDYLHSLPAYNFNVYANGWYNIDCYVDAYVNEVTTVKLTAVLNMPMDTTMEVYLCIPQRKLLSSSRDNKGRRYTFFDDSDTIPLILNDEAFIFATGSYKDKMYYGITKFITKKEQVIILNIKESTREEILASIKNNKLGDVKIDIHSPFLLDMPLPVKVDSVKFDTTKVEMQILPRSCDTINTIYADLDPAMYAIPVAVARTADYIK